MGTRGIDLPSSGARHGPKRTLWSHHYPSLSPDYPKGVVFDGVLSPLDWVRACPVSPCTCVSPHYMFPDDSHIFMGAAHDAPVPSGGGTTSDPFVQPSALRSPTSALIMSPGERGPLSHARNAPISLAYFRFSQKQQQQQQLKQAQRNNMPTVVSSSKAHPQRSETHPPSCTREGTHPQRATCLIIDRAPWPSSATSSGSG